MGKKYSVLLMRDDTSVRRFRVRPFWIKFFALFFVILGIVAGAGVYFSVLFFQEKEQLETRLQRVSGKLEQTAKELENKRNLQAVFETYEARDLHSLLTVPDAYRESSTVLDLSEVFAYKDKRIVSIDNIQASFNNDRMRVQLEINNLMEGETISGRVFLHVVRRDGGQVDLELEHEDLYYTIARFKEVDVTFQLPGSLDPQNIFALRIKVENDDQELIYSETFPLSNILVQRIQ
ncbi:hypothetical protein [Desulfonatronospira sp.]|uniref:hypothetical protein n=1 Tax=Desulfonatronospira sp. TaxID=1962951 RepID=UPI0025BC86E3|nr:hypothetical protein [Desulfonatronospira sp.]